MGNGEAIIEPMGENKLAPRQVDSAIEWTVDEERRILRKIDSTVLPIVSIALCRKVMSLDADARNSALLCLFLSM